MPNIVEKNGYYFLHVTCAAEGGCTNWDSWPLGNDETEAKVKADSVLGEKFWLWHGVSPQQWLCSIHDGCDHGRRVAGSGGLGQKNDGPLPHGNGYQNHWHR